MVGHLTAISTGCAVFFSKCPQRFLSGASFTGVLPNRRKSGELFLNLLDLRGPAEGDRLWNVAVMTKRGKNLGHGG